MFDQSVGVSEEQHNMIDIFEQILSAIKTHLKKEETKEALSQFQLDAHVDMMDIFYRKKEKGQLVSCVPPTLYPKLQTKFEKTKRDGPPEIITEFRNVNDELINPNDQLGVRCRAIGNIMIDNIYVASAKKPSIQLKLDEVIITEQFKRVSRLRLPKKFVATTNTFDEDDEPVPEMKIKRRT